MAEKGNGDITDLTFRLLREIRADVKRIEATMATKDELAKVKEDLAKDIAKVKDDVARLDARNDVLLRVVKENHRVVGKRIRALEIRVGARRPR